jgi:hypothetical protein
LNLKPKEVCRITLRDYLYLSDGYNKRERESWSYRRELFAMIHNSGFNAKKALKGSDILPFPEEKQDQSLEELLSLLK